LVFDTGTSTKTSPFAFYLQSTSRKKERGNNNAIPQFATYFSPLRYQIKQ